jgi:hypothetical protein
MKYQLLFCLISGLFLFYSCGSSTILPESNLAAVTPTSTTDKSPAVDTSNLAFEDTSFSFHLLHLIDSLYLPTGYVDDMRTGFQGEVNALQLTSGSAAFQQVVARALHRLLKRPDEGGPADEAFYLRYLAQRKAAYRIEMEPQIDSDEVNFGDFAAKDEVTMKATFNKSGIFTLRTDLYNYGGGAYGGFSTRLNTFTDKPAKRINKEDLFITGTDAIIGKMLAANIGSRKLYYPEVTFPVTNNFGLTAEGLVFVYPSYEVEVVGNGQVVVTLPLATLLESKLLTPAGRELLERLR